MLHLKQAGWRLWLDIDVCLPLQTHPRKKNIAIKHLDELQRIDAPQSTVHHLNLLLSILNVLCLYMISYILMRAILSKHIKNGNIGVAFYFKGHGYL